MVVEGYEPMERITFVNNPSVRTDLTQTHPLGSPSSIYFVFRDGCDALWSLLTMTLGFKFLYAGDATDNRRIIS